MNDLSDDKRVTIFHRLNMLKMKAGAQLDDERYGFINSMGVKKAQASIDKEEENYSKEIEAIIVKLETAWEDLKNTDDPKKQKKLLHELYNYANNVKDIATTFNYSLMGYFGKSLRDFCEKIDLADTAHHTIVQAHIDVMWVTLKTNLKGDGGEQAQELKEIVEKAIEQHS